MNCLKCGKETENQQVFCQQCLESMEAYPVKPGAAVHLPAPQEITPVKKPFFRRKNLNPEEQLIHLRRSVRRLTALAALLAVLLVAVGAMLVQTILGDDEIHIGKNYTIDLTGNQDP